MIKILSYIFMLFIFSISLKAYSVEHNSRWIDLEWDKLENSGGYDLELFQIIDNKDFSRGLFHTKDSRWAKEVLPGNYKVKIRSLDDRNVPGPWGEAIIIKIELYPTQLIKPLQNENFTLTDRDDLYIHFQWSQIIGANYYQFLVIDSKKNILFNEMLKENEISRKLNHLDNYTWIVIPLLNLEDQVSSKVLLDNPETLKLFKPFSIKGPILKSPIIEAEIVQNSTIHLKWDPVFRAENYNYELYEEIPTSTNKNLKKVLNGETSKHQFNIAKKNLKDAVYLLTIQASANRYQDSEKSKVIFKRENDKLLINSNESQIKETDKRPLEWSSFEGQFGYPTFNYSSRYYETDTLNDQTLRGVRLQARWRKNISDNRYQNFLKYEIAQVADSNISSIFYSVSENIGKTFIFGEYNTLIAGGIHFDSTPLIYADRITNKLSDHSYKSIGPETNIIISRKFSKDWSGELKSSMFFTLLGISNPNHAKIKPSISSDSELKLLYTVNSHFDFYSGLNYTSHTFKTLAATGGTSFAQEGDIDEIKYSSIYLIFGAEFFY